MGSAWHECGSPSGGPRFLKWLSLSLSLTCPLFPAFTASAVQVASHMATKQHRSGPPSPEAANVPSLCRAPGAWVVVLAGGRCPVSYCPLGLRRPLGGSTAGVSRRSGPHSLLGASVSGTVLDLSLCESALGFGTSASNSLLR